MPVTPIQLQTSFGGYVAEQHDEDRAGLRAQGRACGIAGIWLAFYAVIAVAAMVQHFGVAVAHHV